MRSLQLSANGKTAHLLFTPGFPVIFKEFPVLFCSFSSGSEYVVAGHEDWKTGRAVVNTKSLVKPWRSSLGIKFLHILRKDCGHRWGKGDKSGGAGHTVGGGV